MAKTDIEQCDALCTARLIRQPICLYLDTLLCAVTVQANAWKVLALGVKVKFMLQLTSHDHRSMSPGQNYQGERRNGAVPILVQEISPSPLEKSNRQSAQRFGQLLVLWICQSIIACSLARASAVRFTFDRHTTATITSVALATPSSACTNLEHNPWRSLCFS